MTQDGKEKRKALGRGLDTLLPASHGGTATTAVPGPGQARSTPDNAARAQSADGEMQEIPLDQIERNPFQTRNYFKEESLNELAASIKANGVMQPVMVRRKKDGKFQLIAGERRCRAAQIAGKLAIPALIKEVSDQQALEMTIIENIQREDLNPIEQAQGYNRLAREFNMTQEQMAVRTGKDRTTVANYLRLLKLPFEVQNELQHNFKITLSHAKLLLMLDTEEQIKKVAQEIIRRNLSVLQTEELVFNIRSPIVKVPGTEKQVDPNVREAERLLERSLGMKVRIKDRKGRGKIVIEYARLDDFDRILEMLGGRK